MGQKGGGWYALLVGLVAGANRKKCSQHAETGGMGLEIMSSSEEEEKASA